MWEGTQAWHTLLAYQQVSIVAPYALVGIALCTERTVSALQTSPLLKSVSFSTLGALRFVGGRVFNLAFEACLDLSFLLTADASLIAVE